MKIGRPDKFEVTTGALEVAVRGLLGIELSKRQTKNEAAARRLCANVLRSEGASYAQIAELVGADARHLVRSDPPVGTPVWACWKNGLPDDPEAEEMGNKLRAQLRSPVMTPAAVLDATLAQLIDKIEETRRALRRFWRPE